MEPQSAPQQNNNNAVPGEPIKANPPANLPGAEAMPTPEPTVAPQAPIQPRPVEETIQSLSGIDPNHPQANSFNPQVTPPPKFTPMASNNAWPQNMPSGNAPKGTPMTSSGFPPAQPRAAYSPSYSNSAPRHTVRKLVILLIFLLVLTGAAFAAYAFVLAPNVALPNTWNMLLAPEAFHGELHITTDTTVPEFTNSQINIVSDTDKTDPKNPKSDVILNIVSPQFSFSGELIVVNNTAYFQVTTLNPRSGAPDSSLNHWYSTSLDKVNSMTTSDSSTSKDKTSTNLIADLSTAGAFATKSFTGFALENGTPVRMYKITIDNSKLASYLSKSASSNLPSGSTDGLNTSLQMVLNSLDISPIIISTDLVTGSPRSIKFALTINKSLAWPNLTGSVTLNFAGSFKDKGIGVKIVAPDSSTAIDNYLSGLANSLGGLQPAKQNGMDARIKADIQQLRINVETLYDGKTFKGGCTGSNADQILQDLKAIGSSGVCNLSTASYAVYGKLTATSSSPTYFCIDSNGKIAYLGKAPTGYSCK